MKWKIAIAIIVLAATATVFRRFTYEQRSPWPTNGVFVGYYWRGFEVSDFKPLGTRERWWLTGNIAPVASGFISPSATDRRKFRNGVYLVVRGTLSPEGSYGHLSHYSRELVVQEVVEVREVRPDERVHF